MNYDEHIARLINVVERLTQQAAIECKRVEHYSGDDLFEELAALRNIAMQLEGLKMKLTSYRRQ